MGIHERISFFRKARRMTLKQLGISAGFSEKSADIRVSQYESGARTPKADSVKQLASILDISPQALNVPDIETPIGLLHTLFALEDLYGISIVHAEGEPFLFINSTGNQGAAKLRRMLLAWSEQSEKLANGVITKEAYDQWRYNFSEKDLANAPESALSRLLKSFQKYDSQNI